MVELFYILNLILLGSCVINFRVHTVGRQFTVSLIRAFTGLLLLMGGISYFYYDFEPKTAFVVIFSEAVLSLIWLFWALRLHGEKVATEGRWRLLPRMEISAAFILAVLGGYFILRPFPIFLERSRLVFPLYGPVYFYALFTLGAMLYMAWRMEGFWRGLPAVYRWEYKFLVVGSYMICGTMVLAASYRVTYLRIVADHLILLGIILLIGWGLMVYAAFRHRLLNRMMFVSRKIVYSSVAPLLFAIYLLGLGIISLIMRYFGLSLSFVLQWLLIILGAVAVLLYFHSGRIRRRVHFFISTNFYMKKYEYREEWLKFSRLLKDISSESEVIKGLKQVLSESLYTSNISIWVGNEEKGFKVFPGEDPFDRENKLALSPGDPIISYLKGHGHFFTEEDSPDQEWRIVMEEKKDFLDQHDLVLVVPLSIGEKILGLIGIGPEYTGGHYGQDDFDLLSAMGAQAASALMAVHMTEEVARARQMEAWNALSAFVIHDIKNAATMLSLIAQNAAQYLNNPDFQRDMLKAIDNALSRMNKVQERLASLKEDIKPICQDVDLGELLEEGCQKMGSKFPNLKIILNGHNNIKMRTDSEILFRIFENLLLNSHEAGGSGTEVNIRAWHDEFQGVFIEIQDNGPGIKKGLLPEALFEPFVSTKPKGTGIGLWQVKWLVKSLGGHIMAENVSEGGAKFTIKLPMNGV